MNNHVTPRGAELLAAGAPLQVKEDQGLDLLVKAIEQNNGAVDGRLKSLHDSVAGLGEQLATLEQNVARGSHGGAPTAPSSWGEQFVKADGFKSFAAANNRLDRFHLNVKATMTSATADAAGSAGALLSPYRDTLVGLPRRRLTIRDLIPTVQISTSSVEIPKVKARTNNSGMVAEGAAKPSSDLQIELATVASRTIAHWTKASRQILDDAPQLRDLIDGELRYGLALKEETQLLSGDGTGQNLLGLIPQATAYSLPSGLTLSSPTSIDLIGAAITQVALANFMPDGIVMHPADWMRIRLLKDAGGNYLLDDTSAAGLVPPTLFGLPVVTTQSMTVDKFLVGQFSVAATIYDRWTPRVEIATENEDDFTKNLVTILCEERLAFAVKQPLALVYGDFGLIA